MPSLAVRTALAANQRVNTLSGSQFEIAPFNAYLEAAVQADATGVLITVQTGSDVVQEEAPAQLGTINTQPKYPDDYYVKDVVGAGERINVIARDTSGAARVVMTNVILTPI